MVHIRPARSHDAGALVALTHAAYEPYVPRIGKPPAPMTADYGAIVESRHAWVAEVDGRVAGLIVLVPEPDHLLLENVAVAPEAQGRGVGSRLLAFADGHARALGLPEVRLFTNEAMTENLEYYPRRGYVETHRARDGGFNRVFFAKSVATDARPES